MLVKGGTGVKATDVANVGLTCGLSQNVVDALISYGRILLDKDIPVAIVAMYYHFAKKKSAGNNMLVYIVKLLYGSIICTGNWEKSTNLWKRYTGLYIWELIYKVFLIMSDICSIAIISNLCKYPFKIMELK